MEKDDEFRVERRYYISSLQTDAALFAKAVREHWDIEVMHGYLDVLFKEDSHKVLNKTTAMNLNVLRKIALAILKKWTPKTSFIIYGTSQIFTIYTKYVRINAYIYLK